MNQVSAFRVEDEILTRVRLYDFSTGKQTFFEWQAGMLPALSGKRVLELGCGNGELWRSLLPRWRDCELTLTDISPQMVDGAKATLAMLAGEAQQVSFDVVDLNKLPYESAQFDVVISNHNLFYADNVANVLSDIERCLAPGGMLICSTIGGDHLHQLAGYIESLNAKSVWAAQSWADVFGLENGGQQLLQHFCHVDQYEYDNNLHVTSVDPLLSYLKKAMKGCLSDWVIEKENDIVALLAPKLNDKGYIRLTPHSGFFVAHKAQ